MIQPRFVSLSLLAASLASGGLFAQHIPPAAPPKSTAATVVVTPGSTPTQTPDATAKKAKATIKAMNQARHKKHAVTLPPVDPKVAEALAPMQTREPSFRTEDEAVVRETRWVKDIYHDVATVPVVNCGVNIVSMVVLPTAEQIVENGTFAGNTQLWGITPVLGKNVIFLKPVMENIYTNLTVVTKVGNIYQFALRVDPRKPPIYRLRVLPSETDGGSVGVMTPGVMPSTDMVQTQDATPMSPMATGKRGVDPEEVDKRVKAAVAATRVEDQARSDSEKKEFAETMLAGRNDDYTVSYDRGASFKITHVFDVAGVTYIRYKTSDQTQPSFYVVGHDGNPETVTWVPSQEDPSVLMVDRVFGEGVLKVGDKGAKIINRGLKAALARELEKEPKEKR